MPRITRVAAFSLGLLGAACASQFPEFAQQYRQRLGGTIDELSRIIARFDADASAGGETREGAIARLRSNPDDIASRQGAAMQGHVERRARLEEHRSAMAQAAAGRRLLVALWDGDRELMAATFQDYEPALPITQEGVMASAVGFVAVWGGVLLLASFVRRLIARRRVVRAGPLPVRAPGR